MERIKVLISLFVFLVLFLPLTTFGQLNLKVGYSAILLEPEINNSIILAHNSMEEYSSAFPDLNYLHGLNTGFRYRFGAAAAEFNYVYRLNQINANKLSGNNTFKNRMNYNMHSFGAGLEAYFSQVGVGITLDYNFLRIRSKFEDPAIDNKFGDQALSSTISLGYTFSGNNYIALSIKPFVQLFWTEFDLAPFEETLTGSIPIESRKEDLFNYGISIILYNGPQN